ncbi:hypothetical protein FRB98_008695 [Tulasnella sp. 332]|nr:hypothetical protein FRB98_008695 [Tulasnella sp. 332]
MNSDTVPATEAAVDTIKRFAMFACTAQQNCQTLFSLISIARDTSEAIHRLIHQFDTHDLEEEKRWMAFDRYNAMLDALESVLRDCSGVIARDHGQFDSVLQSWSQDRAVLRRSLDTLQAAPFDEDQGSLDRAEHFRATFRHDDMSWLETLCDHVKIRMNATGSNNGSHNARSALTMLLELQSQLNWSPEALEVTNELAASIYLVLGSQQDTHNQSAWEIIDRSGSTILHAITSGDFRDLPAVDIKLAAPGKVLHPVMSSEEPVTAGDTKTMFLKPLDPTPSQSLHPDLSPLNSIKVDSLYRAAPEAQGMVNGDTIKLDSQPFEFGEYADVYRGKWVGPSVKEIVVAVKIFHRRASAKNGKHVDQRFEQEIYILHRVRHTRIVPLYGFMASQGIDRDSRLRLVSPYYKNGNLRTYLGNNPGATKLELLYQAAQGLDYLHSYKPFAIAHLDVKAENVLITDEGESLVAITIQSRMKAR